MSHRLSEVKETWDRLGQIDPMWAVLSDPEKLGGKWEVGPFLATGEAEIAALMLEIERHGFDSYGTALDFGCGAGRLSIALSSRFREVVAVDIAPSMIDLARKLSAARGNIRFVLNDRDDLSVLDSASVDLVYTIIVLQHMPPEVAADYIREFYRIAKPGAFVVFHIPSHYSDDWLPGGADGTRLPEGAHQAKIEIVEAPATLAPGEHGTLRVSVSNASKIEWTQDLTHRINLGNHWFDERGTEIVHDDGRQRLPGRLAPGAACELDLTVRAPDRPGKFEVELDVVQERVCWFAAHGSSTARRAIRVEPPVAVAQAGTSPENEEYPIFMMKGIPFDEVKSLVESSGGEILQVFDYHNEWVSYRYITRKKR